MGARRRPPVGRRPAAGVCLRGRGRVSHGDPPAPGAAVPRPVGGGGGRAGRRPRAERDGRVVGYGWLDDVWGDAEVLLAVDEGERGSGVGSFVMAQLEQEAAARGLNYVVNVVRDSHPARDAVTAWLEQRGFAAAED